MAIGQAPSPSVNEQIKKLEGDQPKDGMTISYEAPEKKADMEAYVLSHEGMEGGREPAFAVEYKILYRTEEKTYTREGLGKGTDVIVSKEISEKLKGLQAGEVIPAGQGFPTIFEGCVVVKSTQDFFDDTLLPGTRTLLIKEISSAGDSDLNNPSK